MAETAEHHSLCPLCGGRLRDKITPVPYVFGQTVIVIRDVPAEVCDRCNEPYMTSLVVERVMDLLVRLRKAQTALSVISYKEVMEWEYSA